MRFLLIFVSIIVVSSFNCGAQNSSEELLERLDTTQNAKQREALLKKVSDTYENEGNLEKALLFSRRYRELKDSLFLADLAISSEEIEDKTGVKELNSKIEESQLELDKVSGENAHLRNAITGYVLLAILFSLFLIIIIIKINRKRRVKQQLSLQKKEVLLKYNTLEEAYTNVYNAIEVLNANVKEEKDPSNQLPDWVVKLSKKEVEVLSFLVIGMTDKEISENMSISVSTVRTYCRRVYGKLLVKTRLEAANFAIEHNML